MYIYIYIFRNIFHRASPKSPQRFPKDLSGTSQRPLRDPSDPLWLRTLEGLQGRPLEQSPGVPPTSGRLSRPYLSTSRHSRLNGNTEDMALGRGAGGLRRGPWTWGGGP